MRRQSQFQTRPTPPEQQSIFWRPDLNEAELLRARGFPPTRYEQTPYADRIRQHVEEIIALADIPPGSFLASSPQEVRDWMHDLSGSMPEHTPFPYVTGGFECGIQHEGVVSLVGEYTAPWSPYFIMGLEPDRWIEENKTRDPVVDLEKRVAFWRRVLPSPSCVFVVPPGTTDYDELSQITGTFRHPNAIHLGYVGDTPSLKEARRHRAATPRHFWNLAIGVDPRGIVQGIMVND
ncbi:MAG: hypothetical protein PHG63_02855 [Candidatus Dojkabacteria bacterium]|nr:hypothetical protein [Candidatus Dojkabacteria bacterium]